MDVSAPAFWDFVEGLCLPLHAHVCAGHVCAQVHVHVCAGHAEALHRFLILHFESGYLSYFLAFFLDLAGSSCLCLSSTEIANTLQHRAFFMWVRDLNSGPHLDTASTY